MFVELGSPIEIEKVNMSMTWILNDTNALPKKSLCVIPQLKSMDNEMYTKFSKYV